MKREVYILIRHVTRCGTCITNTRRGMADPACAHAAKLRRKVLASVGMGV